MGVNQAARRLDGVCLRRISFIRSGHGEVATPSHIEIARHFMLRLFNLAKTHRARPFNTPFFDFSLTLLW